MTSNPQFDFNHSPRIVLGANNGLDNGPQPPVTPKSRKSTFGNSESTSMQAIPSEESCDTDTTTTGRKPSITGFVSSVGFLPPTPEPAPETTSTDVQEGTLFTPVSFSNTPFGSVEGTTHSSSSSAPLFGSTLDTKYSSSGSFANFPGSNTGLFSSTPISASNLTATPASAPMSGSLFAPSSAEPSKSLSLSSSTTSKPFGSSNSSDTAPITIRPFFATTQTPSDTASTTISPFFSTNQASSSSSPPIAPNKTVASFPAESLQSSFSNLSLGTTSKASTAYTSNTAFSASAPAPSNTSIPNTTVLRSTPIAALKSQSQDSATTVNSPAIIKSVPLHTLTTPKSAPAPTTPRSALIHTPPISKTAPTTTSLSTSPSPSSPLRPRDRYDLNTTRPYTSRLNDLSQDIRIHHQTLEFYRKWTSHFISQLSGTPIVRNTVSAAPVSFDATSTLTTDFSSATTNVHFFPARADYINEFEILDREKKLLKPWEINVAKDEMNALAKCLLACPLPSRYPESEPDILLYRIHTPQTKSPYSPSFGLRCSDWESSLIDDAPTSRQLNGRAFQSHCNATFEPSPYISLHTSVARTVKLIISFKYDEDLNNNQVFVISLNRLRKLGIKARRTDDVLDSFGGKYRKNGGWGRWYDNGVSFVTDSHWVVEQWVPDVAIVSEMSVGTFLDITAEEGIGSGVIRMNQQNGFWDKKLEGRKIGVERWPERRTGERGVGKVEVEVNEKSTIRTRRRASSSTDTATNEEGESIESKLARLEAAVREFVLNTQTDK